jgi:RNA polymerase sigma-70 factor, ECF subfamily
MLQIEITDTNQLVNLLKAKNREAFSILYDNYSAAMFGIICRIVNDKTIAEELLQDVFVKYWKNINSCETSKGTLFTWMLKIVRNTCIDHLRSKQDTQAYANGPEHSAIISKIPPVTPKVDNSELPAPAQKPGVKYSEIIDMVYFLGYSQEEISQLLDIPLGSVKTRSRTGLLQLRNLYKV